MNRLPEDFIRLRRPMLGEEWNSFLNSLKQSKSYGLRLNPAKQPCRLPFSLTPVSWAEGGFYADPSEHPGRHPLHEAGAYYIQEPSAMSVVSLLHPHPGEAVCDLCAAPGGKSTQIAGMLSGQGLLVSNEIIPSRAKILSQNIERLGIANALVTNHAPDRLAAFFPLFFDKIVVDAPCSGEGMFRKDETAAEEWSPENILLCAERQRMILHCADSMLRPGGIMVYSTCTFSPEENEEMIAWFLSTHPDYMVEDWKTCHIHSLVADMPEKAGLCDGRPDFVRRDKVEEQCAQDGYSFRDEIMDDLRGTLRLWPHKLAGEGHFAARLRKGTLSSRPDPHVTVPHRSRKKRKTEKKTPSASAALPEELLSLLSSGLPWADHTRPEIFGEEFYLLPSRSPSLSGMKVLRAGLHLGTQKKNRFQPAHALAKALSPDMVRRQKNCTAEEAVRYLKGETLSCDPSFRGWTLVCYENLSLGWGKAGNGILKNHYPKGLRIPSS